MGGFRGFSVGDLAFLGRVATEGGGGGPGPGCPAEAHVFAFPEFDGCAPSFEISIPASEVGATWVHSVDRIECGVQCDYEIRWYDGVTLMKTDTGTTSVDGTITGLDPEELEFGVYRLDLVLNKEGCDELTVDLGYYAYVDFESEDFAITPDPANGLTHYVDFTGPASVSLDSRTIAAYDSEDPDRRYRVEGWAFDGVDTYTSLGVRYSGNPGEGGASLGRCPLELFREPLGAVGGSLYLKVRLVVVSTDTGTPAGGGVYECGTFAAETGYLGPYTIDES